MSDLIARRPAPVTERWLHIALTVLGSGGMLLLFVPFTYDYVPLEDFNFRFWPSVWMELPCIILPFPISIGYALWLVRGRLPRWFSLAAYVVIALFAALSFVSIVFDPSVREGASDAVMLLALVGVAGLPAWGMRRHPELRGLVALQAYFVFQILFFLLAFAIGEYQIGAWLALFAFLAYLAQMGLAADRRAWIALPILPAALLYAADAFDLL